MTSIRQMRQLRDDAEAARVRHGDDSAEHQDAHRIYADAAHASCRDMAKAVYVEITEA